METDFWQAGVIWVGGGLNPLREKGTREGRLGDQAETESAAGAQELVPRELEGAEGPSLDARPRRPACRARLCFSRPAEGLPWEANERSGVSSRPGDPCVLGEPVESRFLGPQTQFWGQPGWPLAVPAAPSSLLDRARQSSRWPAGAVGDGPPALLPRYPNGKDLSITP